MSSALDQIFVHLKGWLLSLIASAPNWVLQIASSLINIVALLGGVSHALRADIGAGAKNPGANAESLRTEPRRAVRSFPTNR